MSSLDHIGEEIAADVTHHDAALHRILTKLRIFDEGGGFVSQGFRTCAQWLSWRVNWTLNTAREHVRVANALGRLPLIDRALASGELSYCKVRALTRVATPANEAALVEMAAHMTGHHLEQVCRKVASVKQHDDPSGTSRTTTPTDDILRRYVHRRHRDDGMVVVEAVLHPEEADIVFAAIERIAKDRCRERDVAADVAAAEAAAADAAAADVAAANDVAASDVAAADVTAAAVAATDVTAAIDIASAAAAHGAATDVTAADVTATGVVAGDAHTLSCATKTSAETSAPRVRQPSKEFDRATALVEMAQQVLRGTSPNRTPVDIMITIPLETLAGSRVHDSRSCCSAHPCSAPDAQSTVDPFGVAFGGGESFVSATAARRLACDAGMIALIEDANGNAISVGRKTRVIPASMKRAMLRRDCKCRYPGCNARAFLEGHHLEHWANGGRTELANLISLCSYHHRFVHEYGFRLELDAATNTVSVYDPKHDRRIPAVTRPDQHVDLGWPNILRWTDCSITADTQPTWDATPVDLGDIVDVILRAEDRALRAGELDPDDDETN